MKSDLGFANLAATSQGRLSIVEVLGKQAQGARARAVAPPHQLHATNGLARGLRNCFLHRMRTLFLLRKTQIASLFHLVSGQRILTSKL